MRGLAISLPPHFSNMGEDDMTVRELLDFVADVKPNAYQEETLMQYLNECESMVWQEVMHNDPAEYVPLVTPQDDDHELMMVKPFDKCYGHYIQAMIDFQNEESVSYQNNMAMFNSQWLEYKKYMQRSDAARNEQQFRNYW